MDEFSLWFIFRRFHKPMRVLIYLWILWAVVMVAMNINQRVHETQSRPQHVHTASTASRHAHR